MPYFCYVQILMSVWKVQLPAIPTPLVTTLTAALIARVILDLLEMDSTVQV